MYIYQNIGMAIITLVLLVTMIYSWVYIYRSQHPKKTLQLAVFWLVAGAIFAVAYSAWPHIYKDSRLTTLGAGIYSEPAAYLDSVSPENIEEAKILHSSLMGVGWPVTAIVLYFLYFIPFALANVLISLIINKIKSAPNKPLKRDK